MVKRLAILLAFALGATTSSTSLAGPPSNPAFLGIEMQDARSLMHGSDGCVVTAITASSGAEAAGLRIYDIIVALDGVATGSCQQLSGEIIGHAPGDLVKIDVIRGGERGERVTVKATLSSRAEILHRRFVGRALDSLEVADFDTRHTFDLGDVRGDTTILAWFDMRRCGDCVGLIRHLADAVQAPRKGETPPKMIAIAKGTIDELATYRTNVVLGVPLAVAGEDDFTRAATNDGDRVFVMVLDGHGIVRFVTPIAPEDDALDAAIDEVIAAAEQAEHLHSRR